MRIVLDPRVERDLDHQLSYLIGQATARNLERRFAAYIEQTLAMFPRSGHLIADRNIWESWVPRTRLVVWYRFTSDELQIVRVWNSAQDRDDAGHA